MNHILTCTSEELALMVSLSGYDSVAKGIAEAAIGKKTEQEWIAIMEATSKQLIMKRILDEERDARGENPLTEEMLHFIKNYVESKRMIRCSNTPAQSVLMIHHYENDDWLLHLIEKDIIHEFSIISSDEMDHYMNEYYGIQKLHTKEHRSFILSEKNFDRLSNPDKLKKVRKSSKFTPEEEISFDLFTEDLKRFEWTLFNISNFGIVSLEDEMYLENILFFLPSTQGIWLSEYSDDSATVHFYLADEKEWEDMLRSIGEFASHLVEQG
ncbi:hypothetical protein ACRTEV_12850 [Rossellomorea arthrocnemi]